VDYALLVRTLIEQTLHEGFTTVRDAGGLDPAWARAVAVGRIRGPRILPSGSFLTQTGGHGDMREAHEAVHGLPSIAGLVANPEVVDGADSVRRAAREQLRRGATQIKLFVSGGVMSPTDPLESIQFTVGEIAAAVEVARSWGTYVLVHAHTSAAMRNALSAGVRSIEHGSILDEETAQRILAAGAFVVPTLLILTRPRPLGPAEAAKAARVSGASRTSVRLAHSGGIPLGSGSDLIGPDQEARAEEIVEKAHEIGPMSALVSATRVNAELVGLADRIGTVEPGKDADLVLVRGNPLDRIETLAEPDGVLFVLQRGEMVRDDEGRASAG
jgi:imidazolonepropionase-like amidohydrolase